jgi:methyl-accepting chemotaxis protein
VVAAEVRNLAQRSAAAAKEIKLLISDSVDKVHEGSHLVEQAGVTMAEVVEEAAASAAAMQDQAARLARAVSVFKLDQAVEPAPLAREPRLALG